MAIEIDVPGVGIVQIDGAAEEETMQEILKEIKRQNGTSGPTKAEKEQEKQTKKTTKTTKELAEEMQDLIDSVEATDTTFMKIAKSQVVAESFTAAGIAVNDFGLTAINVGTTMMRGIDQYNEDVIESGAMLLSTAIDLTGQLAKLATGIAGAVPVVGPGLKALGDAGIDLAVGGLQFFNDFLSSEYQKRVKSLETFTSAGASFSDGLQGITRHSTETGLGLVQFTNIIGNTRDEMRQMGLSATGATEILSHGLKELAKDGGKARKQLLALGYSFEEQGEIMAMVYARDRAAGIAREQTQAQIAQRTKDYAVNLKVLADLTGEDAKKMMEAARAESMRGAIQNKLVGDQKVAFTEAYAALGAVGPEAQAALVQSLTFDGAVLDPSVAANKELLGVIQNVRQGVEAGRMNMGEEALRLTADAADRARHDADNFGLALDQAAIAGSTFASKFADVNNRLLDFQLDAAQVDLAKKTAKEQLETQSALSTEFANTAHKMSLATAEIEKMADTLLPEYSAAMDEAVGMTTRALNYFAGMIQNIHDPDALMQYIKDSGFDGLTEDKKPIGKSKQEPERAWYDYVPDALRFDIKPQGFDEYDPNKDATVEDGYTRHVAETSSGRRKRAAEATLERREKTREQDRLDRIAEALEKQNALQEEGNRIAKQTARGVKYVADNA